MYHKKYFLFNKHITSIFTAFHMQKIQMKCYVSLYYNISKHLKYISGIRKDVFSHKKCYKSLKINYPCAWK